MDRPDEDLFRQIAADLYALGARWALIGALAVGVRAEPRATRDIDLAVAVADDGEAEALVFEMRGRGYEIVTTLEHEVTKRLATVRLAPPESEADTPVLDLLFASSGIETEVASSAETLEALPGLQIPIAATGHLIALKLLAIDDHRPNDLIDLHTLVVAADEADLEVARRAVKLIVERGYGRSRDLEGSLDEAIARWR